MIICNDISVFLTTLPQRECANNLQILRFNPSHSTPEYIRDKIWEKRDTLWFLTKKTWSRRGKPFKLSRCIKVLFYITVNRLDFLTKKKSMMKIPLKLTIFLIFSPTSNHLHPLQVENCGRNSRLVECWSMIITNNHNKKISVFSSVLNAFNLLT